MRISDWSADVCSSDLVTVVVELRARFDEANNSDLAEKLQDVGAHVVYGVVGYKTHAKMCLIVRREEAAVDGPSALRQYAHPGNGNSHPKTARPYPDYGLLTADPVLCRAVHAVFPHRTHWRSVVEGKRVSDSVAPGGGRSLKK